jgi:glycosyltransferase involved in cell wall biosynthesis/SAM-dependent methyltransferase
MEEGLNTEASGRSADERARSLAGLYDAQYFAHGLGQPYRWGGFGWEERFGRIADATIAELAPKTVLDAGCGIGFLVDALRKRGVDAYGFDVSEYAISQVPADMQPFCWVASITEDLDRDYDLILCVEVLEHLPPELAEEAIDNLTGHTDQILFSSTPFDFAEPTHFNVRSMESWIGLFARRGFFRNVDLDASFVAPHAIHIVRKAETAVAVARDYERWHWSHLAELTQLREGASNVAEANARAAEAETRAAEAETFAAEAETRTAEAETRTAEAETRVARGEARNAALLGELEQAEYDLERLRKDVSRLRGELELATGELAEWDAFQGRSGYRIFLGLASVRLRLAPGGTGRDRLVRRVLRTLAGGLTRGAGAVETLQTREGLAAVLFVSACPGDAMRYRCDHQAEELALNGATVDVVEQSKVDLEEALDRYESFVFHRVPWSREVEEFLRQARLQGKPVLFDTDDLVFEPEAREHVAAILEMEEAERALYVHGLKRFQRTLRQCDGVIVSTEPLREAASRYHEHVELAFNVVSDEMTRGADAAVAGRRHREARASETVTIAYFSGTPTHNVDFAEAADAVLWALDTYPHVRFLAVGHLNLDARFDEYESRVQRLPLQPWRQLPELLSRTDINLAPLEPRNPFTDCKSCLKYIEAGLVGTATIASPRRDFVRAIEDGRNGLLADSPEEWRTAVQTLIESSELRRAIGQAAFDEVRANHTVRARSTRLLDSVGTLVRPHDDEAPLTVNWLLRAPVATRGGGYRAIFRLANYLGEQGHLVRVYVEPIVHLAGLSEAEIVAFVEEHFGPLHVEVHVGHDEIAAADATIATNWPTAPTVAGHDRSLFKLYFVADFEPSFYEPEDAEALQAEQTYALPLRPVCLGPYLADVLREHTGKEAAYVDFALEEAFRVSVPPSARPAPAKVLFYARPDQPRRGYDLGMQALARVKEQEPETEVILFGATDEELGSLPFAARNLGPVEVDALAAAFNEAHVFLGLSFTNISHAPFEAMACGCAVVELDVPSVTAMVAPGENCLLAAPDPDELAEAILRLVRDDELRVRLAERGIADTRDATWEHSGAQLERILRETCFVRLPASPS